MEVFGLNIKNLTNNNRIITSQLGNFSVLEYGADLSLSPATAQTGFFMSKMGVRRRQVIIEMNGNNSAVLQAAGMLLLPQLKNSKSALAISRQLQMSRA